MSINVVVSSTAAGVSVSGGTSVAITVAGPTAHSIAVGGGIGPAGFLINPGTATNAFGTFQLTAGDGITISTSAAQFQIASYGTAAVSSLAPVQSVAGRSGAISLAVADVSGLAAVASSGSYTSLQNVPATFAPSAHNHDAAAISSGVLELARIPTIGYTALSGVPATFAPQAHTHSTADVVGLTASFSQIGHVHDYAASVHTHSTADVVGYTSLPAQGGKAGPLVTDGTAATWATRYSVVDPVLVQGEGMTLTRDTAAGSITVAFAGGTSGIVVSNATPQPLGTAYAGVSGDAARADHVHLMPSASDVGAAPASHEHSYVQVLNGLTGTVSIAGGAGVTVSTASSSITIAAAGSFVLPTATGSVLGGIKVGSGLTITDGVLAASGSGGSGGVVTVASIAALPATGAANVVYLAINSSRFYRYDVDAAVYIELGPEGEDDSTYYGIVARYLLVGGGGAGGGCAGGGGGAGRVATATDLSLTRNVTYSVVIGSGGTGTTGNGGNGAASSFSGGGVTLIAAGGGGGGGVKSSEAQGAAGPSGGGAGGGHPDGAGQIQGGAGTEGAGFSGGNSGSSPSSCVRTGGGGGGSTSAGGNASGYVAGSGGNGTSSDIGGATVLVAGGGGGGALDGPLFNCPTHTAGLGTAGGGNGNLQNSGTNYTGNGQAALPNTGSGGGGGAFSGSSDWLGGDGGSGIFIIRTSLTAAATTGSPTVTIVGGQTVYTFTQSGSITF
jgi:hypothetical protein